MNAHLTSAKLKMLKASLQPMIVSYKGKFHSSNQMAETFLYSKNGSSFELKKILRQRLQEELYKKSFHSVFDYIFSQRFFLTSFDRLLQSPYYKWEHGNPVKFRDRTPDTNGLGPVPQCRQWFSCISQTDSACTVVMNSCWENIDSRSSYAWLSWRISPGENVLLMSFLNFGRHLED